MLATGKAKFDVVMANIDSPDLHGFKLLQHAVYMCIPVVCKLNIFINFLYIHNCGNL